MKELILKVEGMMCIGCENRVQNVLKELEGIEEVIADHKKAQVTIKLNKDIDKNAIKAAIEDIGYDVKD